MGFEYRSDPTEPFHSAEAVTPGNAPLTKTTRALYVGNAGKLTVIFDDDTVEVDLLNMPVGIHMLAVKQVCGNTTAGNVVALR